MQLLNSASWRLLRSMAVFDGQNGRDGRDGYSGRIKDLLGISGYQYPSVVLLSPVVVEGL